MTDELTTTHDDIRQHIATNPTNFTDTQGFIATTNVWTMTEAAELLASHYDANTIASMTFEQRTQAVMDVVGRLIRGSLVVSPIRDELLAGGGAQAPSMFDEVE